MTAQEYQQGYDCGLNGPNAINSHFSLFSTPEKTSDWERGKKDGEKAKTLILKKIQP